MFLKKCDRISPLITFSFKGNNMHSSILSGILSIIAYTITTIFGIIYALEFIKKEKPTAYFFNRFIEDAGKLTLDSSSLFHYLYLINKSSQSITNFDFDMVRIIGIEQINIESYYTSVDLEVTPHWLYGLCKNNIDAKNIEHLIENKEEFENSLCIYKYYNPNTRKYYDTNDNENFKWPSIEHGMSHPNYSFYGIIVEKCKNDNLRRLLGFNDCKNNDIINDYIYSSGIVLQLIDHYSDVLNYKEPFTKYFYSISNLFFQKSYTINNMNFNPALIKTHNGIILDNVVEEHSYIFTQNEKVTMDEEIEIKDEEGNPIYDEHDQKTYISTGIVSSYYFWLQNRLQLYERNYKRLQDLLSNIGGLSRTFFLIANIINSFISNYITLLDTEELILSIDNTNYYHEKINNQKSIITETKNENIFPPIKTKYNNNRNNSQLSSNNYKIVKDTDTISEDKMPQKQYLFINKNIINNFNKEEIKEEIKEKKIKNIEFTTDKEKENNFTKRNQDKEENNELKEISGKNTQNKILNEPNKGDIIMPNKKQNFNWFKYIWYKVCCGRNNPIISYYKDYRTKIISEENYIRGQLDIYRLEKICKDTNYFK